MQLCNLALYSFFVLIYLPNSHLISVRFAYQNVLLSAPTHKPHNNSRINDTLLAEPKLSTSGTFVKSAESESSEDNSSKDGFLDDHVVLTDEGRSVPERLVRNLLCGGNGNSRDSLITVRYDLRNGVCAEIGKKEHCGRNMIFKEEIDSPAYGFCDCDFEENSTPLVYHPESASCYYVYTQAYCSPGKWLVFNRQARKAVCESNKCNTIASESAVQSVRKGSLTPQPNSDLPVWVPVNGNGSCARLNAKFDNCNEDEVITFARNEIVPRCGLPEEKSFFRRFDILPNPCPIGSYYSIIGRCQPDWDF